MNLLFTFSFQPRPTLLAPRLRQGFFIVTGMCHDYMEWNVVAIDFVFYDKKLLLLYLRGWDLICKLFLECSCIGIREATAQDGTREIKHCIASGWVLFNFFILLFCIRYLTHGRMDGTDGRTAGQHDGDGGPRRIYYISYQGRDRNLELGSGTKQIKHGGFTSHLITSLHIILSYHWARWA